MRMVVCTAETGLADANMALAPMSTPGAGGTQGNGSITKKMGAASITSPRFDLGTSLKPSAHPLRHTRAGCRQPATAGRVYAACFLSALLPGILDLSYASAQQKA
jgi:hypothetical protein